MKKEIAHTSKKEKEKKKIVEKGMNVERNKKYKIARIR